MPKRLPCCDGFAPVCSLPWSSVHISLTCRLPAAKHLVLYEDGDKEWLNLTAERVEWEQEEQPDAAEPEVRPPSGSCASAERSGVTPGEAHHCSVPTILLPLFRNS